MLTKKDLIALKRFVDKYPSWWYTIGVCDVSRDFTTAPQGRSPEAKYIRTQPERNDFDNGFMCDHEGTVADAIYQVMEDIETAIKIAEAK